MIKVPTSHHTSLQSLVQGFVLCQQTEGKSPHTIKYYQGIPERFLWYARKQEWPVEAKLISEWHIRDFLGYVAEEKMRWGDGSSNCQYKVGHSTLRHYYVGVGALFNWAVREGFLSESPLTKVRVNKAKPRVIEPYTREEIQAMLEVCDLDYQQGAKFLASRNRAVILTLIDSGLRLSELAGMKLADINPQSGWIRVRGKGNKERIVRIRKLAQKALWLYLTWRSAVTLKFGSRKRVAR